MHVGKLGRKARKIDSRTLKLARYFLPALPALPDSRDWSGGQTDWGMMCNDRLGCCTIAGAGHALQVWSKNASAEVTIPDSAIEAAYQSWDGYVPGDSSTDNGGIELDVLNDWRRAGLAGHLLRGYASVRPSNLPEVCQAINLLGGVYIGISLPLSAQDQDVWDVTVPSDGSGAPGSWGGHCVFVVGYDQQSFTCITWGALKKMTRNFWLEYCDETYVLFGQDWINTGGAAPSGFDVDQLTADLAAIH